MIEALMPEGTYDLRTFAVSEETRIFQVGYCAVGLH